MSQHDVFRDKGCFTWCWDSQYFVEVAYNGNPADVVNYIFSDPSLGGNGSFRFFDGTFNDFLEQSKNDYAHEIYPINKGRHVVRDFVQRHCR